MKQLGVSGMGVARRECAAAEYDCGRTGADFSAGELSQQFFIRRHVRRDRGRGNQLRRFWRTQHFGNMFLVVLWLVRSRMDNEFIVGVLASSRVETALSDGNAEILGAVDRGTDTVELAAIDCSSRRGAGFLSDGNIALNSSFVIPSIMAGSRTGVLNSRVERHFQV